MRQNKFVRGSVYSGKRKKRKQMSESMLISHFIENFKIQSLSTLVNLIVGEVFTKYSMLKSCKY